MFISSVQDEFATERKQLKKWLTTDPFVSRFVEKVFLFEDVPSRGKPPEGLTIEKLFKSHTSFPVNDLVLKTFDFAGLIESLGTGIKRMVNACKKNKNPIPEFRQEGSMFVVTLKKRSVARAKTTTLKTAQLTTHTTTHTTTQQARQEAFLIDVLGSILKGKTFRVALYVLQNSKAKIDDIMQEIELTRDGVNYHIRILKKTVGLKRSGPKFDSVWKFVLPRRLLRRVAK